MRSFFRKAPSGWDRVPLKFLIEGSKNGAWGGEAGTDQIDVICVRVADFDWQRLQLDFSDHTTRSFGSEQFRRLALRDGDLVLEKSGGGEKTPVGRVVMFSGSESAVTSNFVSRVRPVSSVWPKFLLYMIAAQYMSGFSIQFVKQNTGIQNLDDAALFRSDVWVPPRTTQKAIADFLDRETARIHQLIEKKHRLVELLMEKKQAFASEAVTGGNSVEKSETGLSQLPFAPPHWRVRRIAAIFRESFEMGGEELPVLSVSINWGISDRELGDEDRHRIVTHIEDRNAYKRVRTNDLVYNMMRAWQGAFGVAKVDGLVSPAYVVARPSERIHAPFFEHLLRTTMWIEEFRRASKGIADFRQRLYWEHFRQVGVVLPPVEEQIEIANRIATNDAAIEAVLSPIRISIERLKEYRSALIAAAVTGQIDVATWGKEGQTDRRLDQIEEEMALREARA